MGTRTFIPLDRDREHSVRVKPNDNLKLHTYQGETWLVLEDGWGRNVVRLYNVTPWQLASLYVNICDVVGIAKEATMEHLRQMRRLLDAVLMEDDAREETQAEA